jgi:hypothetical protein
MKLVNLFNARSLGVEPSDKSWARQLGQAGQRDSWIGEFVDIDRAC